MQVARIEEGLWRWTAVHPAWSPGEDWEPEVGCTYWEGPDEIVLVDPLVPADTATRERFWHALDRDVERLGRGVAVLTTCPWHGRSGEEVVQRYHGRAIGPLEQAATLPAGVGAVHAPLAGETLWWLEPARALVTGDTVLGDGAGGLRLCPDSWLEGGATREQLALELAPVLRHPVERVLVSHGAPVLEGGAAALRAALGAV